METSVPVSNPSRKDALINGVIWAAINIAIFLIVYYAKPDMMGSFAWSIVQFLIGIGLAVFFCFDLRKKAGGYWTFKQAIGNIFLMFFVQAVIVFFFTIIFAKFIEPAYVDKMRDISVNTTTKMMEKMGLDQEKIDEAVSKSSAAIEKQLNPGIKEILVSLGTVAIMYFIGALIFAAIFKKDPPILVRKEEREDEL